MLASEPMLTMLPAAGREHPPARFLAHAEAAQDQVAPELLDVLERDLLRAAPSIAVARHVAEKIDAAELGVQTLEQSADLLRSETSQATATARRWYISMRRAVVLRSDPNCGRRA